MMKTAREPLDGGEERVGRAPLDADEDLPIREVATPAMEDVVVRTSHSEEVRMRLPTGVAKIVEADPAAAVKALARAAEEKLAVITEKGTPVGMVAMDGTLRSQTPEEAAAVLGAGWPVNEDPNLYTMWFVESPPAWPGYWDVTDHKTGTLSARWWYGGAIWQKGDPMVGERLTHLTHEQFAKQFAWRGLKACPKQPYPIPPYNVLQLPIGAPVEGKYVKRRAIERELESAEASGNRYKARVMRSELAKEDAK